MSSESSSKVTSQVTWSDFDILRKLLISCAMCVNVTKDKANDVTEGYFIDVDIAYGELRISSLAQ